MKLVYLLLLALVASAGIYYWRGRWGRRVPAIAKEVVPPLAPPALGAMLGVGTVVISHTYPLAAFRRGPVRHLFVQAGQYVHKGELLLKFYDHSYMLAPASGIVTSRPATASDHRSGAAPVLLLTELAPFQLRLARSAASASLRPGQQVLLQSTQHPDQVVTAILLASQPDSSSVLLNLRLQTIGPEPLPAAATVRVSALPAPAAPGTPTQQ